MPQRDSIEKRIKRSNEQRKKNRHYKTMMRNRIKNFMSLEDREEAKENISDVISIIDKVAQKGIIPDNRAARKKSKLANHISNLS